MQKRIKKFFRTRQGRFLSLFLVIVLLGMPLFFSGCVRERLSPTAGNAYQQIFALQTKMRLKRFERPERTSGDETELIMKGLKEKPAEAGTQSNGSGVMQLISLQR